MEKDKINDKWHSMSLDNVIEKIHTDTNNGLEDDKAAKRLQKHGKNEIPKGKTRSPWQRLLDQFNNALIYILLIAAVVTAVIQHWIDMWVILAVVIINALIGFIQEGRAEKALESLRNMLSLEAVVIRGGQKKNYRCPGTCYRRYS